MLLYNTHGWIHLSIGRPERWFRWGLMEFVCTAGLFLLALRWGPSGIALAWTTSYFLLMFPGFWYAGKPIGLGMGPMFAVIWRFFVASVIAGYATVLITNAIPQFAKTFGAPGVFVRMVAVSLVFFVLYICGVIALHKGLKPINETIRLLRDLLPERIRRRTSPSAVDADVAPVIPA
jgi:polysaccharide transporter, PST family